VEKRKTSINVDPDLWNQWLHFVLDETGSTKKVSEEFEKALKFYMKSRNKVH
jgi:NADH:ubiquinone oxidoreductase subunit